MRVDKALLREAADLLAAITPHTCGDEHWQQRAAAVRVYLDGLCELDEPPLGLTTEQADTLERAMTDAQDYRLGEAYGVDDPDLDPGDRELLVAYRALYGVVAGSGT